MRAIDVLNVIAAVLLWIVWISLNLVLFPLGLILVPLCLWFKWFIVMGRSPILPDRIITTFRGPMWLYGNSEDGLAADWYIDAHPTWSRFRTRFVWSALRNSCNNLQRVKYLNCPLLKPGQLKVKEGSWGCWCRYGPYAGGYLMIRGKRFNYGYGFIGWETRGMPDNDTRDLPCIAQHWS